MIKNLMKSLFRKMVHKSCFFKRLGIFLQAYFKKCCILAIKFIHVKEKWVRRFVRNIIFEPFSEISEHKIHYFSVLKPQVFDYKLSGQAERPNLECRTTARHLTRDIKHYLKAFIIFIQKLANIFTMWT